MPNYSVDWAVEDDYYNSYAMTEDRKGDTTKNNIRVALPKGSMIKRDPYKKLSCSEHDLQIMHHDLMELT